MLKIRPHPTRIQHHRTSYINPDLHSATHVFIWMILCENTLQPPYRGPFQVIRRTDKFFVLDRNGKHDAVSIDGLKPVHVECNNETAPSSCLPQSAMRPDEDTNNDTPPDTPPPVPHSASSAPHSATAPEVQKTRSGSCVYWPARYIQFFVSWTFTLTFSRSSLTLFFCVYIVTLLYFLLFALFLHLTNTPIDRFVLAMFLISDLGGGYL